MPAGARGGRSGTRTLPLRQRAPRELLRAPSAPSALAALELTGWCRLGAAH